MQEQQPRQLQCVMCKNSGLLDTFKSDNTWTLPVISPNAQWPDSSSPVKFLIDESWLFTLSSCHTRLGCSHVHNRTIATVLRAGGRIAARTAERRPVATVQRAGGRIVARTTETTSRYITTYTVQRAGGRIAARTAERRRLANVVTRRTTNRLRCAPTERALQHNKSASSRGRLPSKAVVDQSIVD